MQFLFIELINLSLLFHSGLLLYLQKVDFFSVEAECSKLLNHQHCYLIDLHFRKCFNTLTSHSWAGIHKRSYTKNCLNFKRNVLTVQEFYHKVKTFFCLDKMGFTKGLRQKFVLDFVITLRPLQGRLKSF